ncbi:MAG: 7TM-DISM domain-containing protein, partial [Kangiellaceae bacterium]|nr:7TM-DISM domain-containing protein [Kangiellaceae bacterium]
MKYKAVFSYLVVLIGFLLPFETMAKKNEFAIPADFHGYLDTQFVEYIEQSDAMYTDTQMLSGVKNGWKQLPQNSQFKTDVTYWFKLRISSVKHAHWILSPGFWHQSKIYYSVDQRNWNSVDTSVFQPLSKRQIKAHLPLVRLEVPSQGMDVFIKVSGFRHGREADAQYIQILDEIKFLNQQAEEQRIQGGYLGFSIGLAGFHLVLWFWFRERTYLWLVVAISSSPLFFHAFLGFGLTNLWPSFPVWNEYSA